MVAFINCVGTDLESGDRNCLFTFMSVVSETIGTKGTNGLAVQCVHCERLRSSLIMIDFVLINACMQGSTHTHVLLGQVMLCFNYNALLSTSLLPAASPFSASQFLKTFEDEFVDVVNAKQSLLKLKHKGVISPDVKTSIEGANEEDAKYLLFEHLEKNATVDTLREYCEVAIAADGYPRMQELGRKMINTLPPQEG